MEPSREVLLARIAAGEQAAMAEFYDQTNPLAYGLALRILGDPAAAEDVMVEVYTQVWKHVAEYVSARGSPTAWVLNMTRSRAIDALRARGRDQATEPLEAARYVSADAPGPEALTAAAERHRFVHSALRHLSDESRQLIELAYFAGMSQAEIAATLHQPLGTVKTHIRAAMMQLRVLLAPLDAPRPLGKDGR
ncbi:MAG: sigma-70 family RNA polymerase sigma factor [Candidatus Binatia bacterium]